jgi:hypothetical protein
MILVNSSGFDTAMELIDADYRPCTTSFQKLSGLQESKFGGIPNKGV